MIGEFEYDAIFNDPDNVVNNQEITYIIYVVFMIIMSILIMNLLVRDQSCMAARKCHNHQICNFATFQLNHFALLCNFNVLVSFIQVQYIYFFQFYKSNFSY